MPSLRKLIKQHALPNNAVNELILTYLRSNSFMSSTVRLIFNSLLKNKASTVTPTDIKTLNGSQVTILATRHVAFVADLLQSHLNKVGIHSEILYEMPASGYNDSLYFVLCPHVFKTLPKNYLAFQFEQLPVISRYWKKSYQKILSDAIAVVDYSLMNLKFLVEHGIPKEKLFYLPIFAQVQQSSSDEYEHDVLFYGYLNDRRMKILEALSSDFNIYIADNLFGEQMHEAIRKSKVILNIHSHDDGMVESTRLFECLSMNKLIVSETGIDQKQYEYLDKNIIQFVPTGDLTQIKEALSNLLKGSTKDKENTVSMNLSKSWDCFSFYLNRLFLALGFITLENFMRCSDNNLPPITNCLSIMQDWVSSDNEFHNFFPVLKHHVPWLSNEITIKFLTFVAYKKKMPYLKLSLNSENNYQDDHFPEISDKPSKKGNYLIIPSSSYQKILSWNEYPRMCQQNNFSIFNLFNTIE